MLNDAIKFAMGNGGNPLILTHADKRKLAASLASEFSVPVLIAIDGVDFQSTENICNKSILDSVNCDFDPKVIIFDGDSTYRDYYDNLFSRFPEAKKVCFAKTAFRDDTGLIYDTVITDGLESDTPVIRDLFEVE